jgi:hypothetical protein
MEIHTPIHTVIYRHICTLIYTPIYTFICSYIYTSTHTYIYTYIIYTPIYTPTYTQNACIYCGLGILNGIQGVGSHRQHMSYMHTYIRTCMLTYIRACIHTYIHAYMDFPDFPHFPRKIWKLGNPSEPTSQPHYMNPDNCFGIVKFDSFKPIGQPYIYIYMMRSPSWVAGRPGGMCIIY